MRDAILSEFVRGRHGIFHRRDARALNVSDKMLRARKADGLIVEVLPDTFWLRSVPYTWFSKMRAAVCWAHPAVGSHRAAAAAWELDGFDCTLVEITTARRLHIIKEGPILHIARELPVARTRIEVPYTTVERTLFDLASVVSRPMLERGLDDALRKRLTTAPRLELYLEEEGGKGRAGCRALRDLVARRVHDPRITGSRFEDLLLSVLRTNGLPCPEKQHEVLFEDQTFFFDFAYPAALVAIEAHSYAFHSDRDAWERDQVRNNLATAEGWRIQYVTYRQLQKDPSKVVQRIRRSLEGTLLF